MRAAAGGGALSEQRDWKNGDDESDAEQCLEKQRALCRCRKCILAHDGKAKSEAFVAVESSVRPGGGEAMIAS